jgi:cyclophilin family peptidyl-prolyl cis-trans isomerase
LSCEDFPIASENFLALCTRGFYIELPFHCIIPNFLIQSGDHTRTGTGGLCTLGENIKSPPTSVFHDPWIVAYAHPGIIHSQFFITVRPQPQLNGEYCDFGKVIFGTNVVQTISRTSTLDDNSPFHPS